MVQKKTSQNKKKAGNKKTITVKKDSVRKKADVVKKDVVQISEKKIDMPEMVKHVLIKEPVNIYKVLFWVCFFVILGIIGCVVCVFAEYQLVPREAVIVNVLKGEKTEGNVGSLNPASIKKGQTRPARVLSPEEIQQVLTELRKSDEYRRAKGKKGIQRARKASGSKTQINPVEKPAK